MNIFYTGIGCKPSGIHTENEFLEIMNREFTHKNWKLEYQLMSILGENEKENEQLKYKDFILPDDFTFFTLADWIEYSGAEIKHHT